MAGLAGGGAVSGLNLVTSAPPLAASAMPSQNGHLIEPSPPSGGCFIIETNAFTTGAPAKMMLITTGMYAVFGSGAAPNASSTPNAPTAPAIPAISDHHRPDAG